MWGGVASGVNVDVNGHNDPAHPERGAARAFINGVIFGVPAYLLCVWY